MNEEKQSIPVKIAVTPSQVIAVVTPSSSSSLAASSASVSSSPSRQPPPRRSRSSSALAPRMAIPRVPVQSPLAYQQQQQPIASPASDAVSAANSDVASESSVSSAEPTSQPTSPDRSRHGSPEVIPLDQAAAAVDPMSRRLSQQIQTPPKRTPFTASHRSELYHSMSPEQACVSPPSPPPQAAAFPALGSEETDVDVDAAVAEVMKNALTTPRIERKSSSLSTLLQDDDGGTEMCGEGGDASLNATHQSTPLEKLLLEEVASLKAELEKAKKVFKSAKALGAIAKKQQEELERLRKENSDLKAMMQPLQDDEVGCDPESSGRFTVPPPLQHTAQSQQVDEPLLLSASASARKELAEMHASMTKMRARELKRTKETLAKWLRKRPASSVLVARKIIMGPPPPSDPPRPPTSDVFVPVIAVSPVQAARTTDDSSPRASPLLTVLAPVGNGAASDGDQPLSPHRARRPSHDPSPFFGVGSGNQFKVELGTSTSLSKRPVELTDRILYEPLYEILSQKPHYDFIGWASQTSPVIISIGCEVEPATNCFRALVRTQDENCRVIFIEAGGMASMKPKDCIKTVQLLEPALSKIKFTQVSTPELMADLVAYERKLVVKHAKFGVMYAKEGQTDESDMFGNNEMSADFHEFLSLLGDRIELRGWSRFNADLDTAENMTGRESVFREWKGIEIMYHVSTLLPYSATDTQQIARKSKIGNDIVVIVFKEGNTPFPAHAIKSSFIQVFVMVQPLPNEQYRITVANKMGMVPYSPFLPDPPVFQRDEAFRDFLLTKCLNAEQAAMRSPVFASKLQNVRRANLEVIAKKNLPIIKQGAFSGLSKKSS